MARSGPAPSTVCHIHTFPTQHTRGPARVCRKQCLIPSPFPLSSASPSCGPYVGVRQATLPAPAPIPPPRRDSAWDIRSNGRQNNDERLCGAERDLSVQQWRLQRREQRERERKRATAAAACAREGRVCRDTGRATVQQRNERPAPGRVPLDESPRAEKRRRGGWVCRRRRENVDPAGGD